LEDVRKKYIPFRTFDLFSSSSYYVVPGKTTSLPQDSPYVSPPKKRWKFPAIIPLWPGRWARAAAAFDYSWSFWRLDWRRPEIESLVPARTS
jgi:hypothetical protein